MDKPAAITAELVDVRNVGMHKCIKLTLHIPAERAAEVIAAFGWATAVDPVPVALARLKGGEAHQPEHGLPVSGQPDKTPPASADPSPKPVRAPVAPDKRMTQRAAILCNDRLFQTWLRETHTGWKIMNLGTDAERAAEIVRAWCGVKSRKEIVPGSDAAFAWDQMLNNYTTWQACLEDATA